MPQPPPPPRKVGADLPTAEAAASQSEGDARDVEYCQISCKTLPEPAPALNNYRSGSEFHTICSLPLHIRFGGSCFSHPPGCLLANVGTSDQPIFLHRAQIPISGQFLNGRKWAYFFNLQFFHLILYFLAQR